MAISTSVIGEIDQLIVKGCLLFSPARLNDAACISKLVNMAYRGEFSKEGWTTEADLLGGQRVDTDMIETIIREENGSIMIVQFVEGCTDQTLFCAQLEKVTKYNKSSIIACVNIENTEAGMYFGMLSIHPELQRFGFGRFLINAVEKIAKEKGYSKVKMSVIEQRLELIAYYQRRGYHLTGAHFPLVAYEDSRYGIPKRPDLRLLLMEKILEVSF